VNHGSCRKHQTISKPWFVRRLWDKFRRNLLKGGTVSGIYVRIHWSFDDAERDEHESVFWRVA